MVGAQISLATETQFPTDIDIAFMIDGTKTSLGNPLNAVIVALPTCSAVNTSHFACPTLGPLLETLTMDVVAASSPAPDDIVTRTEHHDTNGAVAFDWLSLATGISRGRRLTRGLRSWRGVSENLGQLSAEKSKLIAQALASLENVDHNLFLLATYIITDNWLPTYMICLH
jgi:hypothetical protein